MSKNFKSGSIWWFWLVKCLIYHLLYVDACLLIPWSVFVNCIQVCIGQEILQCDAWRKLSSAYGQYERRGGIRVVLNMVNIQEFLIDWSIPGVDPRDLYQYRSKSMNNISFLCWVTVTMERNLNLVYIVVGLVIALFSVLEKERPPQKELNGIEWSLLIGKPLYRRFCLPASVIFHGKENL